MNRLRSNLGKACQKTAVRFWVAKGQGKANVVAVVKRRDLEPDEIAHFKKLARQAIESG